jgi:hypothetical protein
MKFNTVDTGADHCYDQKICKKVCTQDDYRTKLEGFSNIDIESSLGSCGDEGDCPFVYLKCKSGYDLKGWKRALCNNKGKVSVNLNDEKGKSRCEMK